MPSFSIVRRNSKVQESSALCVPHFGPEAPRTPRGGRKFDRFCPIDERAVGRLAQWDNVGKACLKAVSALGWGAVASSSLWRSHGEGDRSRSEWWRGRDVGAKALPSALRAATSPSLRDREDLMAATCRFRSLQQVTLYSICDSQPCCRGNRRRACVVGRAARNFRQRDAHAAIWARDGLAEDAGVDRGLGIRRG